ncbi:alpha/beta fold hydrolase [Ramlibacter sp. 2FC]|uniref:alpha/beta fold hydrolase n=1 Tax=Ramlibacter sp. 2FC TaxID=2502188 RepID=UPI0010F8CFEA|nr:alpha/beta fold hydrolase [Ramlibacter sp. 2FC]
MTPLPNFTMLGAGPIILMLHGALGGSRAFAPQVESYASLGYRAVAWDMPGYGHSVPIEPYSFKGLAQSCIALAESLLQSRGDPSLILLGHDIGGMVAQEVVARRPELVNRLILCGTLAAAPAGEAAPEASQDMAQLAQTLMPQRIGPGALPEGVQLASYCMAGVHAATYRKALEAMAGFDRRANLPLIHVPTLLVAGEYDRQTPAPAMREMAAAIPGGRCMTLRGIGHFQNLEAPEAFDGAVLDFLGRTAGSAEATLH